MSIFSDAVDRKAAANIAFKPSANVGFGINTSDYLNSELEQNPFFLSLNCMSAAQAQKLIADSSKSGVSVVVKRAGASKDLYVHVNPKTVAGVVGGDTGKTGNSQVSDDSVTTVELISSGDNQQTPTIFKLNVHSKNSAVKDDNTTVSNREAEEQVVPEPDAGSLSNSGSMTQASSDPNVGPRPNLVIPPDPNNPILNPNAGSLSNSGSMERQAGTQPTFPIGNSGDMPPKPNPIGNSGDMPPQAGPGNSGTMPPETGSLNNSGTMPQASLSNSGTMPKLATLIGNSGTMPKLAQMSYVKSNNVWTSTCFSCDIDETGKMYAINDNGTRVPISLDDGLAFSGDSLRTGTLLISDTELEKYCDVNYEITDLFS